MTLIINAILINYPGVVESGTKINGLEANIAPAVLYVSSGLEKLAVIKASILSYKTDVTN